MAGINVSTSQANSFAAAYKRLTASPSRPVIDAAPAASYGAAAPVAPTGGGLTQEQLDAQSVVGRLGEDAASAVANGSGGIGPTPVKQAGESDAAYADRIRSMSINLNGPVESTGGGGTALKSASLATPSVNRSILGSQNSLSGANISGSYQDSGVDYRSQAEKDAQAFLDGQPTKPKTEQQLVEEKTAASKGLIDSMNSLYTSRLADQGKTNELRTRETNAESVLKGLSGSTEAGNRAIGASDKNAKANQAILTEQQAKLQEIYTKIQTDAHDEAYKLGQDAKTDAKDVLARAEANRTKAVENVKILSGAGFDLDSIRTNDPNTYAGLVKGIGDENKLKALFVINRPKNDVVGTPIRVGDHYVQMYKNPLTGAIVAENVALPFDLPANYSKFEKIKDASGNEVLVAVPDNWDGDVSKLKQVGGGSSGTGNGSAEEQLYKGLSSPTATATRAKVAAFKTEPLVTNFNTIQSGYNFVQSFPIDTKNPADDQALIYALAKALDPGSVVREGEYATAQKYAQSWAAAFGKGITQAALGTGFLSQAARENIKKTIENRYNAAKKDFTSTYGQYVNGINNLTGRKDGEKFLVNYDQSAAASAGAQVIEYNGKRYQTDADGNFDPNKPIQ